MTTYAVGTARVTNASAVVTGTDTTWAVSAVAGGLFTMGGMAIPIRSVESDTSLTLEYAWSATTRTGAYSILLLTAQAASAIEIYRRIQENVAALRNLSALGRVITAIETAEEMRKLLGLKTGQFLVDATGVFTARAQYDARPVGFSFLATDQGLLYLREGVSGWSAGIRFGGEPGAAGPESWATPVPWATGAAYRAIAPRAVVTFGGETFVCIAAHTSSTSITPADTTRWRKVAERGAAGTTSYADLTGKPTEFPPAAHTHDSRYYTKEEIDGRPSAQAFGVGDHLTTLRNPGTGWLRRNGASYLKSAYPTLAALTPSLTFQEVASAGGSNRDIDYSSSLKRLVRVAFSGAGISTSDDDGATWTNRTSPFSTSGTIHFVKWVAAASMWVAGGTGGQLATSPDGITWTLRTSNTTEDLYDAEGDASNLVVVGNAGIIIRATQTGVTWTVRATSVTANLRGIVKSGTTWLVVGTSICLTSTNISAIGWTQRASPGAALRVAAAPDGTIVAINATSVVRSTNLGVTWTASTMDVVGTGMYDVIYGPAGWVIAGNKYLATSVDGQAFVADKLIFTATSAWQFGLAVTDTAYVTCAIGATARAPIPANLNEFLVPNDAPSNGWIKAG